VLVAEDSGVEVVEVEEPVVAVVVVVVFDLVVVLVVVVVVVLMVLEPVVELEEVEVEASSDADNWPASPEADSTLSTDPSSSEAPNWTIEGEPTTVVSRTACELVTSTVPKSITSEKRNGSILK
jgi:hypothetical protein